jgi:formylglycine-generating enzyme required for sulfatase activity
LTPPIYIEDGDEPRRLRDPEFPLALGGVDADIPIPGESSAEPLAFVGMADEQLFVQANGTTSVACNGTPVTTSQWLHDGDVVRIGQIRIRVEMVEERTRLIVERPTTEEVTEPPVIAAGPAAATDESTTSETTIRPVVFKPGRVADAKRARRRFHPAALLWLILPMSGVVAWWLFTARGVEMIVDPEPDRLEIHGTFLGLDLVFGGRHVLHPGSYTLTAEKSGYHSLETPFEVTREENQSLRFVLEKLPGVLLVSAGGVEGAVVNVDGRPVGETPLDLLELPPGEHELTIVAERYFPYDTRIDIEGGGIRQVLDAELVPRWAPISIRSRPAGARIRANGEDVGLTPETVELLEGRYTIELRLAGHKPGSRTLTVVANEPQTLEPVIMELADARLVLRSEPSGAMVTVDEEYQGETPLELYLSPGRDHEVEVSKAGHDEASRSVRLKAGETNELTVELNERLGKVEITSSPAGAELFVDGESRGTANQTLSLPAVPHQIEVRKEGFEPYRATVTPRPGLSQSIEASLKTAEQIKDEALAKLIRSVQGQELVLIKGGRFEMGASRREPGRRANETLHEVELVRPFYLATKEVSNREFREFRSKHLSGAVETFNLEVDTHPVVRVTWDEAALYCNWLSEQDSLPPAYERRGGQVVAVVPMTTGYRLPSEAEWAWAARFPDGQTPQKYPWGNALPVRPDSGNYADGSAGDVLPQSLPNFDDHYPSTAPVDAFEPNALGLFNTGGNVAEWVHDYYTIYPAASTDVETDPLGPQDGQYHVIRGSSWMDSNISELRLTYRDYGDKARPDLGFRIARYAE